MGGLCTLGDGLASLAGYGCAPIAEPLDAAFSVPARALGIEDRGLIKTGQVADLMAVDPAGFPRATWCRGKRAWPLIG